MAGEITIQVSLNIRKVTSGNVSQIEYQSRPAGYTDDMTGAKGPTPGAVDVSQTGVSLDLAELTTPGWCRFHNQESDTTRTVNIGIYETDTARFFPFMMLKPGHSQVVLLSPELFEELGETGTGTAVVGNARLHIRARGDYSANILVEAFET